MPLLLLSLGLGLSLLSPWPQDAESPREPVLQPLRELELDREQLIAASTDLYFNPIRVSVLSGADGSTLWKVTSLSNETHVGLDLAWIEDFDGDGVSDLLTSSRSSQFIGNRVAWRSGPVWTVRCSPSGMASSQMPTSDSP